MTDFVVRVMRDKIREWLMRDGIFKKEVQDDKAEFHFVTEVPPVSSQFIDVIYPKNTDLILVASGLKLSDEHYKAVMSLSERERDKFMWEIRFGLLFLPTEFQIIPDARNPQLFQFTRKLYIENLTRQGLMDAIAEVHKCKLYIIWKLRERFSDRKLDEIMYR